MKLAKAKKLKNGIYRIWWKDNTTSLAAVGRSIDGTPWLAPTNWTNVLTGRAGEIVWRLVDTARLNAERHAPSGAR